MRDSYLLFILQFFAHLTIIPFLMYAEWHHYLIVLFVYFITGCLGMTITYHRLLSHNSWKAPKWFNYLGSMCGVYGLTGSPIAWVAVHREHHRHVDTEADPHSPMHQNFFKVQWLSMFDKVNVKYASHLLRDQYQIFLHKYYFQIHLCIIVFWLTIDPFLVIVCYSVPAMVLWNMGSFVNSLNHRFGYKNYNSSDSSTNLIFTGLLVWGEGWHNNHHAKPSNSSFKKMWWELDIGSLIINLLKVKNEEK